MNKTPKGRITMNTNWKDMTPIEKVVFIITCIAAVIVVVANLKPNLFPVNITCPAIAVVTACEAIVYWKQKRKWAYLLIAGAVISMLFFLLEFYLVL